MANCLRQWALKLILEGNWLIEGSGEGLCSIML